MSKSSEISKEEYSRALSHLRHDLYAPLNVIKGFSELLLEEIGDEPESSSLCILTEELKKIRDWGNALQSLVGSAFSQEIIVNAEQDSCLNLQRDTDWVSFEKNSTLICDACTRLTEKFASSLSISNDLRKIHAATIKFQDIFSNYQASFHLRDRTENDDWPTEVAVNVENSESPSVLTTSSQSEYTEQNQRQTECHESLGRILIVDDNEDNLNLLSRQIERQGYLAFTASDGNKAIELISKNQYDLILLDIMMPIMDGYQVLRWLRSSPWHQVPVIVISSLDDISSIAKCIEMGAEDYLHKPFNITFLKARLGASLEKKRLRDQEVLFLKELEQANQKITTLNNRLTAENSRLSAELDVARQLQQMVLPKQDELHEIANLEISAFMEAADEVGGDYYDVIQHHGHTIIGIGDVMGHGLQSGVLMLMLQTAVQTLVEQEKNLPENILETLNSVLCKNLRRMGVYKTLTLSLIDCYQDKLYVTGQHEDIIIIRSSGRLELVGTTDLGIALGLEDKIFGYVNHCQMELFQGDVVVLFTDGVTEAGNHADEYYGMRRLCEVARINRALSAEEIKNKIILDLKNYAGDHGFHDDVTVLVIKKR
jgi:sigma-B regulation protein RsbU (phosphoserine phosphatase)